MPDFMAAIWTPTLRAKSLLIGCIVALVVSLIASSATYLIAYRYLLNQRESVAVTQSFAAARLVARGLADGQEPLEALLEASRGLGGSQAMLRVGSKWLVSGVGISETDIPDSLKFSIDQRQPSRQRTTVAGKPLLFTAIPIEIVTSPNSTFVGAAPLVELNRALTLLRNAFGVGIILATMGGGVIGLWLSRRISEPLHTISNAASRISAGDLSVRINEPHEPDLAMIARSFNTMTASMQERAERDIRFAGHVSHELKSPLTVIRGAAELVASRRADLPQRIQFGVDVLIERVIAFEKILSDLIEISRRDANVATLNLESLQLVPLIQTLLDRSKLSHKLFIEPPNVAVVEVLVDTRRFAYCFTNIVDNARLYGHGLVSICCDVDVDTVTIHFDDAGEGVPEFERARILEPFSRGSRHSKIAGSGLGLTIVAEHMKSMGGFVVVDESPIGGARFSLTLTRSEGMK